MKNRIQYFLLGLLVVFVIAAATPVSFLKLLSDADGNQHSITNLASLSVDLITGDATNQFAVGGTYQPASENLTNWSGLETNILLELIGDSQSPFISDIDGNLKSITNLLDMRFSDSAGNPNLRIGGQMTTFDPWPSGSLSPLIFMQRTNTSTNLVWGIGLGQTVSMPAKVTHDNEYMQIRNGITDKTFVLCNNGLFYADNYAGGNAWLDSISIGTNSPGSDKIKVIGNVDATSFTVNGSPLAISITNVIPTDISYTNGSFAGPTNSLLLNNNYQLYVASGNCAITNVTGTASASSTWSTLIVSNSTASAITLSITIPSARKIGTVATNSLYIGAGKLGVTSVLSYGESFIQYWNTTEP